MSEQSEMGQELAMAQREREKSPLQRVSEHGGEVAPLEQMGPPPGSTEGIGTLRLTKDEQRILLVPPNPETEVDIRPDGLIYVPHTFYRRRLTLAFSGAWGVRAEQPPGFDRESGAVVFDGSLWIKGKFVRRAMGECRWYPRNKRMTKASAFEGAESDCIVRCCKALSVCYELWDPQFSAAWKAKYAETYQVRNRKGEMETRWRRKGQTVDPDREVVDAQFEEAPNGEEPGQGGAKARRCDKCGRPMALRTQKSSGHQFWGCTGYPECRHTVNAESEPEQTTENVQPEPTPVEKEPTNAELGKRMVAAFDTAGIIGGAARQQWLKEQGIGKTKLNKGDLVHVLALQAKLLSASQTPKESDHVRAMRAKMMEAYKEYGETEVWRKGGMPQAGPSQWTPEQVGQYHDLWFATEDVAAAMDEETGT